MVQYTYNIVPYGLSRPKGRLINNLWLTKTSLNQEFNLELQFLFSISIQQLDNQYLEYITTGQLISAVYFVHDQNSIQEPSLSK